MKKVTLIPGPSWIEYRLTLKIRPLINEDKRQKTQDRRRKLADGKGQLAIWPHNHFAATLSGIEHQTAVKPATEASHHKPVSEFSDHNDQNFFAS